MKKTPMKNTPVENVSGYQTSDGIRYDTEDEASIKQFYLDFETWFDKEKSGNFNRTYELESEDVLDWIKKNKELVKDFLHLLYLRDHGH